MNTNPNYRPGWKARTIIAAYLAAMLLTFVVSMTSHVDASPTTPTVQQVDEPQTAICHPYAWKKKFGTVFWTKLFPGTGYEVTIDYEFKYNGCHVQIVWRDCEVNWAVGWVISEIKCKHWANATNTQLYVQVNYLACGPGCYSGWAKRTLGVNGQTIKTEGSFIN